MAALDPPPIRDQNFFGTPWQKWFSLIPKFTAETAITANNGVPVGTIIDFSGTSAPTGYLVCPTASGGAQIVSRTTYAALFAAIGTAWGVGDGSTTFGIPWFAADYAAIQASANVGTNTVGQVIAHSHAANGPGPGVAGGGNAGYDHNTAPTTGTTQSTGGTANLAAGVRVLKCVKY